MILVESLSFMFIINFYFEKNVFSNLFLLDGLIFSVKYLYSYFIQKKNLSENYTFDFIDKYVIYGFYILCLSTISLFFWIDLNQYFNYTLVLIIPIILNIITEFKFNIHIVVKEKIYNFYYFLICNIISYIVNKVSKVSLDINPNIDYREFLHFFEKKSLIDKGLKQNVVMFIRQVVTFIILNQIGITYIYKINDVISYYSSSNSNSNENLGSQNSKIYICDIIKNRQWNKFNEIKTLNHLFDLIINDISKHKTVIKSISNKFILDIYAFLILWSLSSLHYFFGILVYFCFINVPNDKVIIKILQFLLSIFIYPYNIVVGSFTLIYSHYFFNMIYKYNLLENLKFNEFLSIYNSLIIIPISVLLYFFNYTVYICLFLFDYKSVDFYFTVLLCFFGVFSNFKIQHLLSISTVLLVGLSIYVIKNTKENNLEPRIIISDYFE